MPGTRRSPAASPAAPRTYRGASAEDRRLDRQARFREAAFEAFARLGIAHTTMRDICVQARLSDRYFYESFESTEHAFNAVYQWQRQMLLERIGTALQEAPKNVPDLARAGLGAFYAFLQEDLRRARLVVDAFGASQHSADKSREAVAQYVVMIGQLGDVLYPQTRDRLNTEMVVSSLVSMAIQVAKVWANQGFKQPIDELVDYNLFAWRGLHDWLSRWPTAPGPASV